MDEQQARRLLMYTSVMWDRNPDIRGVVTRLDDYEFAVAWDNGRGTLHRYDNAHRISLWHPRE